MAKCETGWKASQDPAFVDEAQIHAAIHHQVHPLWLTEAISELCAKRRTKGHGTRVYNAAIRRMRYEAVHTAKQSGMSWPDAYDTAAKGLAGTRAKGEASTMKAAYIKVVSDLKNGRRDRYLWPQIPNMKLGDALRRKPSPSR